MTTNSEKTHCNLEALCRVYHHRTKEYNKDLPCGETNCSHNTRIEDPSIRQQEPLPSSTKKTSELPKIIPPLPEGDRADLKTWHNYWRQHDRRVREDVLNALVDDLEFLPSSEDSKGIVWIALRDVRDAITIRKREVEK